MCCGYEGITCSPTSDIYSYSIQKNTWKKLYESALHPESPEGRSGCGCSSDGLNSIYIFGGKASERLNDMWRFDLNANSYERVNDGAEMRPNVRNGHSMNFYDGKLYVFGGIHEVTWELDDLHIFDTHVPSISTIELQVDHIGGRLSSEEVVNRHAQVPGKLLSANQASAADAGVPLCYGQERQKPPPRRQPHQDAEL